MVARSAISVVFLLTAAGAWAAPATPSPPCASEPARHEIVSYSIEPEHPKLGEPIFVTVVSRLVGEARGGFFYSLTVDGQNFTQRLSDQGTGQSVSGAQFVLYPVPPGPLWIDISASAYSTGCRVGQPAAVPVYAYLRDLRVDVEQGPPACAAAAAEVDVSDFHIQERGGTVCRDVTVDGACCWRARISGTSGILTTPAVQCGSHPVCASVFSCDGPDHGNPFELNIAGHSIRGICEPPPEQTPTPTVTPTPAPGLPTPECRAADTAEIEITSLTVEPEHPSLGEPVHVRATSRVVHGLTFSEFDHSIRAQGEALTAYDSKPGVGTDDSVEFVLYPTAAGALTVSVGTFVQTAKGCYDGSFAFTLASATREVSLEVGENPRPCKSVDVLDGYIFGGERGGVFCRDVTAPDDCCWSASVSGFGASLTTPPVQCGSHPVCVAVSACDCSACWNQFEVNVADKVIPGECRNRTPTASPTGTPTPTGTRTPEPTPLDCSSPFCDGLLCGGGCDGAVTVSETLTSIAIVQGDVPVTQCPGADRDGDHSVTVADIVRTVNLALFGCGPAQLPGE